VSLLLRNANVFGGALCDVLIADGRIAAIGPGLAPGLAGLADSSAEVVNLDGRFLLPGLLDDHVHLTQHALTLRRVDVSAAGSAGEAARLMVDAALVQHPHPEVPFVGFGFRDGLWADRPTAAVLDAAFEQVGFGGQPMVLIGGDLHCVWLNSAALARFGLSGHPTGILREDDAFPVTAVLQDVPTAVLDGWVADAASAAARRGVVGVVDFEMADNLTSWSRRFASGFDALRIAAGVYSEHLDAAIAAGHHTGQLLRGEEWSDLLTVGPFKVITDGSLNTRTAYCVDEYPGLAGQPNSRGILTVPPNQLVALLAKASAAGFLPAVHAIGDEANRLALDAFETVGCRGRIEHAQLVRDADFVRFAALGVSASVQPEHAVDDRDVADRYWAGRTDRAFALRSLLDAGAELILGSDAPVAPLDPWITIAAAVGRTRDGLAPWHPEQAITVAEAIAASAHGRSTIAVGEVADLVIVDRDPLTADPEQLRAMPVSGTLLAGRWTHRGL
jgi:predicted amidohydrolase YtcJ